MMGGLHILNHGPTSKQAETTRVGLPSLSVHASRMELPQLLAARRLLASDHVVRRLAASCADLRGSRLLAIT